MAGDVRLLFADCEHPPTRPLAVQDPSRLVDRFPGSYANAARADGVHYRVYPQGYWIWGPFQIAAGWSYIDFDNGVFENIGSESSPKYAFADPRSSVSAATTWALGANWWLNPNPKTSGGARHPSMPLRAYSGESCGARRGQRALRKP